MLTNFPINISRHSQDFRHLQHRQTIRRRATQLLVLIKATGNNRTKHRGLGTRILMHRITTSGRNRATHRVQATRRLLVIRLRNPMLLPTAATRATHPSRLPWILVNRPMARTVHGHSHMRRHLTSQTIVTHLKDCQC